MEVGGGWVPLVEFREGEWALRPNWNSNWLITTGKVIETYKSTSATTNREQLIVILTNTGGVYQHVGDLCVHRLIRNWSLSWVLKCISVKSDWSWLLTTLPVWDATAEDILWVNEKQSTQSSKLLGIPFGWCSNVCLPTYLAARNKDIVNSDRC